MKPLKLPLKLNVCKPKYETFVIEDGGKWSFKMYGVRIIDEVTKDVLATCDDKFLSQYEANDWGSKMLEILIRRLL